MGSDYVIVGQVFILTGSATGGIIAIYSELMSAVKHYVDLRIKYPEHTYRIEIEEVSRYYEKEMN